MKWIKYLLQILIITLGLIFSTIGLTHAQGEPTDAELWWDSKTIHHFLVKPSPNASGLFDFFESLEGDPEVEKILSNQLIKKYPSLKKLFQRGLDFKRSYQELVESRIGGDHSSGYNLFFANYAIQRILELSSQLQVGSEEVPLTYRERERIALGKVSENFGLGPNITPSDLRRGILENTGGVSEHYENALMRFDRLMFFLENETDRKRTSRPLSVQEILQTIMAEITEARKLNLVATLNLAKERRRAKKFKLENIESGSLVSVHDLGEIQRVQEVSQGTETHKLKVSDWSYSTDYQRRPWLAFFTGGWSNFFVPELSEPTAIRDFKLPPRFKPKTNLNSILIECDAGSFVLSIDEYSKLLNELRLKGSENLQPLRNKTLKRFQVEASARDGLLADLYEKISSHDFESTNALLNRLELYQEELTKDLVPSQVSLSLISSMEGPQSYSALNFLNGIRWWGHSLHPGNWLRREKVAEEQLLPHIFSLKTGRAFKRLDAYQKSALKKERKMNRSWRASRGLRRWRTYRWALGLMAVIGPFGSGFIDINLPSAPDRKAENMITLEESASSNQIHSRAKQRALESQEVFHVIRNSESSQSFRYSARGFDGPSMIYLANQDNFPQNIFKDTDSQTEPASVKQVGKLKKFYSLSQWEWDLSVHSRKYTLLQDSRAPIASIPGYKLRGIHLEEVIRINNEWRKSKLTQGEDFEIYMIPNSGLYYVEIFDPKVSQITYVAAYESSNFYSGKPIEFIISSDSLRGLHAATFQIGALGLSFELKELSSRKNGIEITDLEQTYTQNTYYTYNLRSDLEEEVSSDNLLSEFAINVYQGNIYYQCSGASSHLKASLDYVFANQGSNLNTQLVSGYYINEGSEVITAADAHQNVLVFDDSSFNTFSFFDSTPSETQPDRLPFLPLEFPEGPPPVVQVREPRVENEDLVTRENRIARTRAVYQDLINSLEELGRLAERDGPGNPIFRNSRELRSLPQTQLNAIANQIKRTFNQEVTLEYALFRIFLISMGQFEEPSQSARIQLLNLYDQSLEEARGHAELLHKILISLGQKMTDLYSSLDRQSDNSEFTHLQYLLSNRWRTEHQNVLRLLLALDVDLLFEGELSEIEFSRLTNNRCENLFIESYL